MQRELEKEGEIVLNVVTDIGNNQNNTLFIF